MNPYAQLGIYLGVIVLLVLLSACFSCADMVYSIAPISRLERKGTKTALLGAKLAKNYDTTIVAILFGNNLVNILASSLAAASTRLDIPWFNQNRDVAAMVMELSMLLVILIFGEILPKTIGREYPYKLAIFFAKPVRFLQILFYPIVVPTTFVARKVTSPLVSAVGNEMALPSNEELQAMVDTIEEEGVINEDQSEMLTSAIEFKDTCAYEIMTPRVRVEGFEIHDNLARCVQQGKFHHSRIVVYDTNLDNVRGYLPLKDVQKAFLSSNKLDIKELMIPILAIPRTMEISSVLKAMKRSRHHIVLVIDEYGGTDGIVTMEDILEELVGEMFDESEPIREEIAKTDKRNVYLVRGSIHIEDFFDFFHIDEEELGDGVETLSGWLSDRLGRFPKEGDFISLGRVDIFVEKTTAYTAELMKVHYHPRRKLKN